MLIILPFAANTLLSFIIGLLIAKGLGPSQYGRFAFVASIAVLLQTIVFDWLRQSALRFYSDHDKTEAAIVRATLDRAFAIAFWTAGACAMLILAFGHETPASSELAALAIGLSMSNGAFDLTAALARARFLDRPYMTIVLAKNLFALVLAVGGAFWAHSAAVALLGVIAASLGSILLAYRALEDRAATPDKALLAQAKKFAAYSAPIVIANLIYNFLPTLGRGLAALSIDFAQVGQWSLAFDLGVRIVSAVGSAMDALLFQIAIARERTHGQESANAQIAGNAALIYAVLAPTVAGTWAVMPSFEALMVPAAFHGDFAYYFVLSAPALLVFALINFAINPAYQLAQRTTPMIVAALCALAANLLALILLPPTGDAGKFAMAQSLGAIVGLAVLTGALFAIPALRGMRPRLKDLLGASLATVSMCAAIWPLRALPPGFMTLAAQLTVAAIVYGAIVVALNVADLRLLGGLARERLKKRFT